jgi:hypothetical protein
MRLHKLPAFSLPKERPQLMIFLVKANLDENDVSGVVQEFHRLLEYCLPVKPSAKFLVLFTHCD